MMILSENIYIILLLALLIRAVTDFAFPSIPYLWRAGESIAEYLSSKLDRQIRSMATRSLRGGMFLLFLILCAFIISTVINVLHEIFPLFDEIVAFFLFYICLGAVGSIKKHLKLFKLLKKTKDNRDEIIDILQSFDIPVSRVTRDKDVFVRLGIISIGYSINRFLIAPLFWFLLLGFLGMIFYVLVMSAAIALPYKEKFDFGWSSRKTARLMDFLPSILTGIILFIASWSSFGAKPRFILKTIEFKCLSYGLLFLQSILSGAVGGVLGGIPRHWYIDKPINDLWLGRKEDSAKVSLDQLNTAIVLSKVVFALILVLVSAFCINFTT